VGLKTRVVHLRMEQQLLYDFTLVAFQEDVHSNPPLARNNPAAATMVVTRPARTTPSIRITHEHSKNKSISCQPDLRIVSAVRSGSYL
jgi:hypothetical protein